MSASTPLVGDEVVSLAPFVDAGVLDASAVHVAGVIARSIDGVTAEVLLGAALATRAPTLGHVCVAIGTVAGSVVVDDAEPASVDSLPWPEPATWAALLAASQAVWKPGDPDGDAVLPLVWDGTRLYLERYWRFERRVADELLRRAAVDGGIAAGAPDLETVLDELFGPDDPAAPDRQREAARCGLTRRIAVIAGGPGTGKTFTIARLLGAAHAIALARGQHLEVALAAPTGKAATRMTAAVHEDAETANLRGGGAEALRATEARTLHRLLGLNYGRKPRHDRSNPLPHSLVIVDETSMVSLPILARLLDTVRPDATVVLVGDPFQLESVEAGAVLGEIVGPRAVGPAAGPLADHIALLERVHRFGKDSEIASLADAIRTGDADRAVELLREHRSDEITWVTDDDDEGIGRLRDEAAAGAAVVVRAARAGEAEESLRLAHELKVICATKLGSLGVAAWTDAIEELAARSLPDAGIGNRWYVGQPIIVTRNDYLNRVFNGDVGIVVARGTESVVAFADPAGVRELAKSQLGDLATWWAMSIHKSQGSEFDRVIVSLPRPPSPILTRELLYTAVTRAKQQVTLIASEAAVRAAISTPGNRASGLREALWTVG